MSLVCGDGTGTTFCGDRTIYIWDNDKSTEHVISTSTLFSFNQETYSLTIKTTNPSDVGTHNFILKAKLMSYSTPGLFPQTTAFTVTVTASCNCDQTYFTSDYIAT